MRMLLPAVLLALTLGCSPDPMPAEAGGTDAPVMRVATWNASLTSDEAGGLLARLEADDEDARRVAAIIQRLRPDILLLNEFDYDPAHAAADLFESAFLGVDQFGERAIHYPYRYLAPVNTGVPSGFDLDGNGRTDEPADAWGFGHHPGQYGMLLLSMHPLDQDRARSFRTLRWADLPGHRRPVDPASGEPWFPEAAWEAMPLSSKSHWDVPVLTPLGRVHVLAAHPTPPVFDGPENRNGLRNHDEIRLWAEYLSDPDAAWLVDDRDRAGGLHPDAAFVILGDYNADPVDGDSVPGAIQQLLEHPRVLDAPAPASPGAVEAAAAKGGANLGHRGDPAHDTGNFSPVAGNLRVDYVLPSTGFRVVDSGVYWPLPADDDLGSTRASDHHLVWVDLSPGPDGGDAAGR